MISTCKHVTATEIRKSKVREKQGGGANETFGKCWVIGMDSKDCHVDNIRNKFKFYEMLSFKLAQCVFLVSLSLPRYTCAAIPHILTTVDVNPQRGNRNRC